VTSLHGSKILGLHCYYKALFAIDETSYISSVCNCELRPLRCLLHRIKEHFKYQCGCVNFYFKSGSTTTVTFRMFEVVSIGNRTVTLSFYLFFKLKHGGTLVQEDDISIHQSISRT
jgi:hypothetical protein